MSAETRQLSRALLIAIVSGRARAGMDPLPHGNDLEIGVWNLAERWDAEGQRREAIEEKSFVPTNPQKADGK